MFESESQPLGSDVRVPVSAASVREWIRVLAARRHEGVAAGELIDRLRALEDLKSAAAAAQAEISMAFETARIAEQASAGVAGENLGAGVAAEIALARRESPHRGGRHLGLARALVCEMPYTLQALRVGALNEWRAVLLTRETACLAKEDRAAVDRALAEEPEALEGMGDRRLVAEAKKLAYRLDPASVARRAAKAEKERSVTCRPAPDTMAYVTALLPVAQGVAVHVALQREADRLRSQGDPRGRGQIMADVLVERVTGQVRAADISVMVQLVMTDSALLCGDSEPAQLQGYGVVPAQWARDLVSRAAGERRKPREGAWLRRLFAAPDTGRLVAMESRARKFPPGLRRLLLVRDATCRTPWCDAPIRHHDHIRAYAEGGATSAANGQGLCERCNLAKQAPGWKSRPERGDRHTVRTTTPSRHSYRSTAPPLPGKSHAHMSKYGVLI